VRGESPTTGVPSGAAAQRKVSRVGDLKVYRRLVALHLTVGFRKGYVKKPECETLVGEYNECSRILHAIERAIESKGA
jgi:hypothetical protein